MLDADKIQLLHPIVETDFAGVVNCVLKLWLRSSLADLFRRAISFDGAVFLDAIKLWEKFIEIQTKCEEALT